uniref:Reverse transcriptase zinc-binding domain-containing protein n=1 Tax=Setaria viridis TaxID=4556 RepID=A0A4U6U1R8_SETVI|nr:hypothetical protein SEVIR_6G095300v2 [Setaria viridis]
MPLDSNVCEMCIRQKRETITHLFLRCSFAKACWNSVGISYVSTRSSLNIFNQIRRQMNTAFFMEVIILMTWSIWTTRNDWTFNNLDPSIAGTRSKFLSELSLVASHRMNSLLSQTCFDWILSL